MGSSSGAPWRRQSRLRALPEALPARRVRDPNGAGFAYALFVSRDETPTARLAEPDLSPAVERRFVFYARGSHERVELRTTGADLGIAPTPTPDAIKAVYDPGRPDFDLLLALWEARDFAGLGPLGEATAKKARDTPALALAAAAAWETGREAEGAKLAAEYHERVSRNWTMDFTAIALHYLGLAALEAGSADQALALLQTSFEYSPFDRTAQVIQMTGQPCPKPQPRWLGLAFPIDYRLPLLDEPQPGAASLTADLQAMASGQALLLCLLDGYRGNGPCDSFMSRYIGWATHFAARLGGLHVITEQPDKPAAREFHFRSESGGPAVESAP